MDRKGNGPRVLLPKLYLLSPAPMRLARRTKPGVSLGQKVGSLDVDRKDAPRCLALGIPNQLLLVAHRAVPAGAIPTLKRDRRRIVNGWIQAHTIFSRWGHRVPGAAHVGPAYAWSLTWGLRATPARRPWTRTLANLPEHLPLILKFAIFID